MLTESIFSACTPSSPFPRPRTLAVKGQPSRWVVFAGNILTDASGEEAKLVESVVEGNLAE